MTTQTERITLSLCDKHQIGEPYVFQTLDTELELTVQDWLAVGAAICAGAAMLILLIIGAYTVVRWLL